MTQPVKRGSFLRQRDDEVWLRLEHGKEYEFDMPKEMIQEVSSQIDLRALVEKSKPMDKEATREMFSEFGRELMKKVIEVAERYKDRTAEMIEIVAHSTGIGFPHRLQRYLELFFLSSRPNDKWSIAESNTKKLKFRVHACSIYNLMTEAGQKFDDFSCKFACISAFQEACRKTEDKVSIEMSERLPRQGVCEFIFIPLESHHRGGF